MAPRANKKRNAMIITRDSSASCESDQDASQEGKKTSENLMAAQELLSTNRGRRDAKRKAIEAEHKQRVDKTRAKIETFYDSWKQKVSNSQTEQWNRLDSLLKKRRSIETLIITHLKNVEQISFNLTSELDAVYAGRLEDIVEMDTMGRI